MDTNTTSGAEQVRAHARFACFRWPSMSLTSFLLSQEHQTFEEIVAILQAARTIKDVRISISARAFGVEWAAEEGRQETFTGLLKGWISNSNKRLLFCKWEDCKRFLAKW